MVLIRQLLILSGTSNVYQAIKGILELLLLAQAFTGQDTSIYPNPSAGNYGELG